MAQQQSVNIAPGVVQSRNEHGREFIDIEHPCVSARLSLEGAHIVSCVPTGQKPLLWLSPEEPGLPGTPLRGGIPLCWPWFGGERPGPAHGIARTSIWKLEGVDVTPDQVVIKLQLPGDEIARQLSDEQWQLSVLFVLGRDLQVTLTTTNTGDQEQRLGQALHTYLPVADINQTQISGLDGTSYFDQLTGQERVQQGPVRVTQETDRIYHGDIGVLLLKETNLDQVLKVIEINGAGSRSTVVWNPWQEKALRLGHFPPEGYRHMLCIETANAGPDTRVLQPGQAHSLGVRIGHR